VDGLDTLFILDPSTQLAAFRGKQIHNISTPSITKQDVDSLKGSIPNLTVQQIVQAGGNAGPSIVVRGDAAPTNDLRVRQAISKAIDRQAFIDGIYSGLAQYSGFLSVTDKAQLLSEADAKRLLPYDLAGAKQLASAAGFNSWNPTMSFNQRFQDVLALVQSQLKGLGITGTASSMDSIQSEQWFSQGGRDFVINLPGVGLLGPNQQLFGQFRSNGTKNPGHLNDPQVDMLIDAQAAELKDAGRRTQLLQQLQQRVIETAVYISLVATVTDQVWWPFVKNQTVVNVLNETSWYETAWLDV
jgi:peptide/nickel transport system substrate-binding protein